MFARDRWTRRAVAAAFVIGAGLPLFASTGSAIPAFARRYNQSCTLCHSVIPKLGETGEMFAGHGFRITPGEAVADTVAQDDPLLTLPSSVPLAIRVDSRFALDTEDSEAWTDFQGPWVVKILSSAPLSADLSYYFYFLMNERGDVAGVEDAFLYWNDVGGRPVDLTFGQFQVSDPLFKRELRLPVEDFVVYRARVGSQSANLAYERGVMAIVEPAGFRLTLEVVNGNGIVPGEPFVDDDPEKNVFGHLTRDLAPFLRLGALGYFGRQRASGGPRNEIWMAGGDATIAAGSIELNLQYLHREDDHPTFTSGEATAVTDGGFAELLVLPAASRWYGYALYNLVENDRGLLDPGGGSPAGVRRYETIAAGAGYVVRRNLRLYGEVMSDMEREAGRFTLGTTFAY